MALRACTDGKPSPESEGPLAPAFGVAKRRAFLPSSVPQHSNNQNPMSHYIDGFVLSVPKTKLAAYKKVARKAGKIWREHGALEYRECIGDDLKVKGMVAFPKMAKAKSSEVVIFAYARFESRKHRDAANKKIMADPRMAAMCGEVGALFDCKRMAYGGFKTLVALS
jgi:uncharacterized protein YbaA (DUF1428 family)